MQNFIILYTKFYIFNSKKNSSQISFHNFMKKLYERIDIEVYLINIEEKLRDDMWDEIIRICEVFFLGRIHD